MSELNKKLNALSQQQQGQGSAALKPAAIRPITRPQPWRLVGVGVVVLSFVGGFVWWQGSPAERAEAESTLVQVAASVAPVAPAMAAESAESATVIDSQGDQERAVAVTAVESQEPQNVASLPKEEAVVNTATKAVTKIESAESKMTVTARETDTAKVESPRAASVQVKAKAQPQSEPLQTKRQPKVHTSSSPRAVKPMVAATPQVVMQVDDEVEGLTIETVELNAEQLAKIEYQKAEKALKQGDSRKAISFLDAAITYQPEWIDARQKLAALYYGRRESRQAIATLQQGLALDAGQPELRLTMAKLLLNESQQQAALNVLSQPPRDGNSDYLAMRGALAQQLNNNPLALSSYQRLVKDEPYDGRWWMGLGIALERDKAVIQARKAYQQALLMGQISNQSQQFIQQRLVVLGSQEG